MLLVGFKSGMAVTELQYWHRPQICYYRQGHSAIDKQEHLVEKFISTDLWTVQRTPFCVRGLKISIRGCLLSLWMRSLSYQCPAMMESLA